MITNTKPDILRTANEGLLGNIRTIYVTVDTVPPVPRYPNPRYRVYIGTEDPRKATDPFGVSSETELILKTQDKVKANETARKLRNILQEGCPSLVLTTVK